MPGTRPHLSRFSAADALSAVRLPLAVLFVMVDRVEVRLGTLALAALTDLGDGWVARRFGASRIGAVLDPIVDKLFMLAAFGVVLVSGQLAWPEVLAVLLRDIIASAAVVLTLLIGARPATTVPARIGGKAVTLLQLLTLLAFLVESRYLTQLAWATGAVSLYALWDYNRLYFRKST